jgi:hypothetical protein
VSCLLGQQSKDNNYTYIIWKSQYVSGSMWNVPESGDADDGMPFFLHTALENTESELYIVECAKEW